MPERLRIALLIESSRTYGRDLLRGVAAYARAHRPWSFYHQERVVGDAAPARLADWGPHGVIARIESRKMIQQIKHLDLPTVDLFGLHDLDGIPTLMPDQQAIVRLAADHLRERGFEHFAYCGFPGVFFSEWRSTHFVQYLAEAGYEASVYKGPRTLRTVNLSTVEVKSLQSLDSVAAWLNSLPKPVGLMACNDIRAQQVLSVCAEHGIAVPDEVAVIGVDNDDVQCELCNPPLSTVDPNIRKVGYEAAALLDRMIEGRHPPSEKILIDPLHVVARQSTDVVAIANSDVVATVRFIREHACEGIRVEDLVQHIQLSRSTLERRFAKFRGRSPSAEIIRVQLQRVKELLRETDFPLVEIAQLAGFNHIESMCKLFKSRTGRTPGQYRKESRA